MNKLITAIVLAAATYAFKRYVLEGASSPRPRRQPIESWENEGGALAPHHAPVETSLGPRLTKKRRVSAASKPAPCC